MSADHYRRLTQGVGSPPGEDNTGGAAVTIDSVVLMLGTNPEMRGGVASVVATLRDAGLFERANIRYVSTHVDGTRLRKILHFAHAAIDAFNVLRREDVAVVHAHVSSKGSFWRKALLLWVARRFGVATIFHLHDGRFDDFARAGFGGPLLRWCIRHTLESSSLVVVLSARWSEWARGFAPRCRVRVIGNPVRCPVGADDTHRANRLNGRSGRLLFLGKVCKEKGTFDLIEAFARFHARFPHWRLVVGGNGDVEPFLAEARRLGVHQFVDYLGWVSGSTKDAELASADIFALPSYGEGMPVSVLEAMAFGAAIITTPVGGVPDMMLEGKHALWVKPGDVSGLTEALECLAASDELRARLGGAARQHVLSTYSAETVLAQICEAYADAIESGRR